MMSKNKKAIWLILALMAVFVLALSACAGNDRERGGFVDAGGALEALFELQQQFPMVGSSTGQQGILQPGDEGNTFRLARAATGGFPGLFHPHLSGDAADTVVTNFLIYSLIGVDDNLNFTQDGIITWEKCLDELSFTMTMRPGQQIFWSDGVELTLDDLLYAFEFISHPDYTGIRWGTANATSLVVGAPAFRAGEADHISGLVLSPDRRTLKVYLTEMSPSMLIHGILTTPIPRHHFEGIPVAETAAHPHARDQLIGFGPFIIQTVVPGESVLLRANENYWRGRPNLDFLLYEIVHPDMMPLHMQSGSFDTGSIRHADWDDYGHTNNVQFLGRIAAQQRFYYFNLGTQRRAYVLQDDGTMARTGEIYFTPRDDGHPITNVQFRRAVGYALDQHTLNMTLHNGLRRCATTVLHPFNTMDFIDPSRYGTSIYDTERANRILDEAGFEWREGEQFRRDLNGNPFHVNFAHAWTGTVEATFAHFQRNLAAVGIDFRLYGDYWIEHNVLVNQYLLSMDVPFNSDLHMFEMGFTMGANPSPFSLWGHNQTLNLANYTNPEWQEIMADITSDRAWDSEFLADAFRRWDHAWDASMPAIIQNWLIGLEWVNNRVANWTLSRCTFRPESFAWYRVALTAPRGYVH